MLELLALEFSVPVDHQCCDWCNPAHFADYETLCVEIHGLGPRVGRFDRAHVCLPCVRALARASRGVASTNARDLAAWGRLLSKADEATRRHWATKNKRQAEAAHTRLLRNLQRGR